MQPLSKVFPKGNVIFGAPDNIAKRPTVAVKISQCIIEWADIESMLGMCLAILLDADRETALEMYAGVENRSSQFKMLESAARVKLADSPDLDIFTVLLNSIIRPSMRERDKLAHWCWGFCPEIENALVLTQLHHKMASHIRAAGDREPVSLNYAKIFVVTADDLTRMLARLAKAKDILSGFMGSIWSVNDARTRDRLRLELSNEPEIQTGILRLIQSRNKSPGSPQPSPPEEFGAS